MLQDFPLLKQIVYRVESAIQTFFMAHKDMVIGSQCRLPPEQYTLERDLDDSSFIKINVQVIGFEEGTLVVSLLSSFKDGREGTFVSNEFQMYLDGLYPKAANLNSLEGAKIDEGIFYFLLNELRAHLEGTLPFVDPKGEGAMSFLKTYDSCRQGITRRLARELGD